MHLWLSESDVRAAVSISELIGLMESALADFSAGSIVQPVRTAFALGNDVSFFGLMPAYDRRRSLLGAKLVTVVPGNSARGLPTHQATISLFDPETGELAAVVDGRYITEVRTAAVSAVSARHLARRDAAVLGILGSGVQARSHVAALREVRDFGEIHAWSPNANRLREFTGAAGAPVRAARTAEEAVRGADVVVVATSSVTPAIDARWVDPGTPVIAIGACRPSQREIDPALVARARLVVDSRRAALEESGDVVHTIAEGWCTADHIHAELGEVISGSKPGRSAPGEVTLFKSLGLAIEDVAAAALAYRRARETGRGVQMS